MKLLLTSGGLTNPSIINALTNLVAKPINQTSLTFITTAANVESGDKRWLIKDLSNCNQLPFKTLDILDFSTVAKDVWLPRLEQSDILLFGGGNTFHLMYWMEKIGLDKLLPKMLKEKIYVGISAGSIMTADSLALSRSNRSFSSAVGEYKKNKGLGLVSFQIQPHLNSKHFTSIDLKDIEEKAKNQKQTIYVIDDNSAVLVEEESVSVISEGDWKKFN
jgi:dipeptidase E